MAQIISQITIDERKLYVTDVDPSAGAGTPAPTGDLAIALSNSFLYQKRSVTDTDWQIVNSKFNTVATGIRTNDSVGIGGDPNASAILELVSTTKGFLPPRMTSTQRLALTAVQGLLVFDTTLGALCRYTGTTWQFEVELLTTAIQTSTSNAYANITELLSASLDAGLYVLESRGIFQSTATGTGIGIRMVQGTATISQINLDWAFTQGGNGTDKNFEYSQTALADNITSGSTPTANVNLPFSATGVFRISAQGSVQFQIRSENNGTGVSIRPDSVFILKKVG